MLHYLIFRPLHPLSLPGCPQELGSLPEARESKSYHGAIPPATYKFRLYSGKVLELFSSGLFKLDGKLCQGPFTGDDFCIVSVKCSNLSVHVFG